MTPERWQEIKAILEKALQLAPDERPRYLDGACCDENLRRDIESLIAHGEGDDLETAGVVPAALGFETADLGPSFPEAAVSSPEGRRIGPYRLRHEIGRGGMGTVYLAVRDDEFKKRVAIKLLRKGMETEAVMRRFRNERQILAGVNHPHVAELHDGGTTEDGLPYFVMEYIEGRPIDEYCDSKKLSITERLKLFRKVCSAVHFAHQNLVVHRDLKPANILVNNDGQPKLLDFGIAKLLNPELTASTMDATGFEMRLMTPEYASPEQVRGEPITTASDIYALGVLLYELLTGHRPYQLRSRQLHEIARVICEEEPTRPSTAIDLVEDVPSADGTTRKITPETVSKTREGTTEKLRRKLKGDLDNIVLMAIRKEPDRRYPSAEQLSEDFRRVLEGLPVKARKGTLAYRSSKFIKRHGAALAAASVTVIALVGFTIFTMRERDRANAEAEARGVVSDFLKDLFTVSDPSEARGNSITARELLDRGAEKIQGMLTEQPETRAELMATMGEVYRKLGLHAQAEPLYLNTVETQKRVLGDDHPSTLGSMTNLALLYRDQGRYDEAEPLLLETLATGRRVFGDDHRTTLNVVNSLAGLYWRQGRYDEAEPLYLETLATGRRVFGDDHPGTIQVLNNLAILYRNQGRYDEAEPLYLQTLEAARRVLGDDHGQTLNAMNDLAVLYRNQGRHDEAEPLYLETLAIGRRVFGDDHPGTLSIMTNLAVLYKNQGRYDEAEPIYLQTLETQKRALGDDHPSTLRSMHNLAVLYKEQGRYEEAEPLLLETVETRNRVLGDDHPAALRSVVSLAELYQSQGRFDEAEPLYLETLETQKRVLGADHPETGATIHNLGCLYRDSGRHDESRQWFEQAQRIYEAKLGPDHPSVAENLEDWAALLRKIGDHAEANRMEARAKAIREKH